MKYVTVSFLTLLLLSCNNNSKQESQTIDNCSYNSIDKIEMHDTLANEGHKEESNTNSESYESSSYSHGTNKPSGYHTDNMRGFDPASEDDMEDNGMSRYMENNDEEGWD